MITALDIKGFKSVRQLHLDCRRINLFIGGPNTGKSNILEALGFLSWGGRGGDLHEYVRFTKTQDIFYDGLVDKDAWQLKLAGNVSLELNATYESQGYSFTGSVQPPFKFSLKFADSGEFLGGRYCEPLRFIKFYRFKVLEKMEASDLGGLLPPHGRNLVALVFSRKELRQLAADYFAPFGLQFIIKPHEHRFEVQKQSDGVAVSFPYHLTSDTLQRMLFFTVAIESSKESTLVLEEPEAHAFPYFTKYLGERIALDENRNQYFIATHNPYLLSAVVEKAPEKDVQVFATYYRDYETRVKPLGPADLERLFEGDPFLGIEDLVEEEA